MGRVEVREQTHTTPRASPPPSFAEQPEQPSHSLPGLSSSGQFGYPNSNQNHQSPTTEVVKAGSLARLCNEIERLQDALDGKEKECVSALQKYDDLLCSRLEGCSGAALLASTEEVLSLQSVIQSQSDDIQTLQNQLAFTEQSLSQQQAMGVELSSEVTSLKGLLEKERSGAVLSSDRHRAEILLLQNALTAASARNIELQTEVPSTHHIGTQIDLQGEGGIGPKEMAGLLESMRTDLDKQMLEVRQELMAHHIEGQMLQKVETERRLSDLTHSVEGQLTYLHKAASLQDQYGRHVESVKDLDTAISEVTLCIEEKREQLRGLKVENGVLAHRMDRGGEGGHTSSRDWLEPEEPYNYQHLQSDVSSILDTLRREQSQPRQHTQHQQAQAHYTREMHPSATDPYDTPSAHHTTQRLHGEHGSEILGRTQSNSMIV